MFRCREAGYTEAAVPYNHHKFVAKREGNSISSRVPVFIAELNSLRGAGD